ncbi:hypothetical protein SDC9_202917 [bioreactor metagenome]|uniref:Uncharacterized protein n=1 Tax=bioreactor metagenome TaxID=1076179 RepID=A0A645IVS1_9ZZZZ
MVIGHQSSDAFEDAETFQTSDSVVEAATPALAVEVAFSAAVMEAYSEGQDLYDEGNFEEAYPLF